MKNFKQALKYGSAFAVTTALPVLAYADDLSADALTTGITSAKAIIIAVAAAIFTLVGILVAIRYAKRAAS